MRVSKREGKQGVQVGRSRGVRGTATGKNIASCVTTPKTAAPSIVHYKRRKSTPLSSYVTSSVQTPPNSSKLNIPAQGRLHQLLDFFHTIIY